MYKKIIILTVILFLVSSCGITKNESNFNEIYDLQSEFIENISYEDLLAEIDEEDVVFFVGDSSKAAKEVAKIFCDVICECKISKAYFINKNSINNDELKNLLSIDKLNIPLISVFKNGLLVGYYDNKTNTSDIEDYISTIINGNNPNVCSETC